jgi:8-oxo-dGTP diphosphatase
VAHVRIRCTGLIVVNNSVLLVKYDDNGIHYNLPGGGLEPGETIVEGVAREVIEETSAEVEVGKLALVYEFAPHKQSGDYGINESHGLHLIFECKLINNSIPQLPEQPDKYQTAVEWVPIEVIEDILLIPNINKQIKDYVKNTRNIEFIEDFKLDRLKIE